MRHAYLLVSFAYQSPISDISGGFRLFGSCSSIVYSSSFIACSRVMTSSMGFVLFAYILTFHYRYYL